MTALELDRKLKGECTRCGAAAGDTNLCERHATKHNAAAAVSITMIRAARRLLELCVDCELPSTTYRCRAGTGCRARACRSTPSTFVAA